MLFAGRLADLYGRRLLFFIGLTIFLIFSIVSAVVKVSSLPPLDKLDLIVYGSIRYESRYVSLEPSRVLD